jgi:HEPN pEK499 p136
MPSPLVPLQSRTISTGLAQRTLKNLDFIQQAYAAGQTEVHVVTQVMNSLLGLLVFPIKDEFQIPLKAVRLTDPPDFQAVRQRLPAFPVLPSLTVSMFGNCSTLSRFFERLRNAISHKNLTFSGDPDSRCLTNVMLTFQDRKRRKRGQKQNEAFDWEITMNGEDLEKLIRYVGEDIIDRQL